MKYFPQGDLIAVVLKAATSDPAHGSVIARHMIFSPFRHGKPILSYISLFPNFSIGGNPNIGIPNKL